MKFIGPYEVVLGAAMFPPKNTKEKTATTPKATGFHRGRRCFHHEHYKKLGSTKIGQILGRKFQSVCSRALTIGARKSGKK